MFDNMAMTKTNYAIFDGVSVQASSILIPNEVHTIDCKENLGSNSFVVMTMIQFSIKGFKCNILQ